MYMVCVWVTVILQVWVSVSSVIHILNFLGFSFYFYQSYLCTILESKVYKVKEKQQFPTLFSSLTATTFASLSWIF